MNEVQEEGNPLSQDFDIKSLLKFALPTIIMMLLMGLYTIVDTIFVARFVGTNAASHAPRMLRRVHRTAQVRRGAAWERI